MAKKNFISGAIEHKGGLHDSLGIPRSKTIPKATIAKAATKPGLVGKQARLAETLEGFHHAAPKKAAAPLPKPSKMAGPLPKLKAPASLPKPKKAPQLPMMKPITPPRVPTQRAPNAATIAAARTAAPKPIASPRAGLKAPRTTAGAPKPIAGIVAPKLAKAPAPPPMAKPPKAGIKPITMKGMGMKSSRPRSGMRGG